MMWPWRKPAPEPPSEVEKAPNWTIHAAMEHSIEFPPWFVRLNEALNLAAGLGWTMDDSFTLRKGVNELTTGVRTPDGDGGFEWDITGELEKHDGG